MSNDVIQSLEFEIGSANGSGISEVFIALKSWIASWPTIADNLSDADDIDEYVGYDGDFTMKTGKTFIRAYNTQGEGVGQSEGTGERDSRIFNNSLQFRFPKLTPQNDALVKAILNGDAVAVFWHDNSYRVLGHKHYRTDTEVTSTTGDSAGSSKGTTYKMTCPDFASLPRYTGDLALPDGTLDCSTDTFTPTGSGGSGGSGGSNQGS